MARPNSSLHRTRTRNSLRRQVYTLRSGFAPVSSNPLERMSLSTKRLGGSEREPFTLEVNQVLPGASMLLWHLQTLKDLVVVARKSAPFTDDFEAYFIYKERMFVVETPFTNIWVSQLGQPANEALFQEIEAHIRRFNWLYALLSPFGGFRYIFLPADPSRAIFEKYYPQGLQPQAPPESAL